MKKPFVIPKLVTPKIMSHKKQIFSCVFWEPTKLKVVYQSFWAKKSLTGFFYYQERLQKKSLPIEKGRQFFLVPQFWSVDLLQCKHFCWVPTVHGGDEFLLTTEGMLAECCKVVGIYFIPSLTFARLKHLNINQFWNTLISETSEPVMFFLRWPKPLSPSGSWDDATHLHDNVGEWAQAEKKVIAKSE